MPLIQPAPASSRWRWGGPTERPGGAPRTASPGPVSPMEGNRMLVHLRRPGALALLAGFVPTYVLLWPYRGTMSMLWGLW